ncbi:MAG: hypothetical protein CSA95_04795 [Bacteroidetes bacterium]|nr:MAG: hypothetical protein CSA95_04795 [Bacteroidota bacterium]PIE88690.1 MAG: hypothetical protein CSA04_00605 [Bacteroidota bacterium]
MKKLQLLFFSLFCGALSFAQLPQGINLQMVVRNYAGVLIPEKQVGLRFTLLRDSIAGTPVYQETQQQTTNQFGLVNVVLGQGTEVFGDFLSIPWQDYNLYLKQELDLQEGDGYRDMGTTQLLSVPYAMISGGVKLQSPNGTEGHVAMTDEGQLILVIHAIPEASFEATPPTGRPPLSVTFTDQSTHNPTTWLWDFGDGSTSTDQYPVHEYAVVGEYTVTLTVGNVYGTDMETKVGYVKVIDCPYTVTDIDGNSYNTVLIGEQCWMQENLRVTHYPNGDSIPYIVDNDAWGALGDINTDDAYCYYENDSSSVYGALYTYAAAIGDNWARDNVEGQGICPEGWHLPTDFEWRVLEGYVDTQYPVGDIVWLETEWRGYDVGTHLKSTTGWNNGGNGDNSSGFTALPGGYRFSSDGTFYNVGTYGHWWSATDDGFSLALFRNIGHDYANVGRYLYYKSLGFSVRCMKD